MTGRAFAETVQILNTMIVSSAEQLSSGSSDAGKDGKMKAFSEYIAEEQIRRCRDFAGYEVEFLRKAWEECLKAQKEPVSEVPCSDRVMWRDVMPGELIEHGDRMYIVGEGWKAAEETQSVGDTVGKHWIPIQRAALEREN